MRATEPIDEYGNLQVLHCPCYSRDLSSVSPELSRFLHDEVNTTRCLILHETLFGELHGDLWIQLSPETKFLMCDTRRVITFTWMVKWAIKYLRMARYSGIISTNS
jgi:hypothetical protein